MKPIVWIGSSFDDLKDFPENVRRSAGHQLGRIQRGGLPNDWKPMSAIGVGVCEYESAMPRVRSALSISRVSATPFTCCTHLRKSPRRRRGKTSISRASASDRYEVIHEQIDLRKEEHFND